MIISTYVFHIFLNGNPNGEGVIEGIGPMDAFEKGIATGSISMHSKPAPGEIAKVEAYGLSGIVYHFEISHC